MPAAHRRATLAGMSTGVAMMIATAPGKLILTGEYAVLDGASAVVVAVDRRAVARRNATPRGSSPFLVAVAEEIAARRGADDPAARAATALSLDPTWGFASRPAGGAGRVPTPHLASRDTTNRGEILTIALAAHAR